MLDNLLCVNGFFSCISICGCWGAPPEFIWAKSFTTFWRFLKKNILFWYSNYTIYITKYDELKIGGSSKQIINCPHIILSQNLGREKKGESTMISAYNYKSINFLVNHYFRTFLFTSLVDFTNNLLLVN